MTNLYRKTSSGIMTTTSYRDLFAVSHPLTSSGMTVFQIVGKSKSV
ncbi:MULTISPECIES: hypothetical protein [unclassified Wolbachia]|nr:hypothetical protein [Wolbachia endosymbiont (group A) of Apoderus coryli]